ncbi:MAG: beta-carotene hydroxylase, partial [Flavobacterium sp.]
ISMSFIMMGNNDIIPIGEAIGFGIMAYGFAYFMVHDVFIHQRIKWFRNANNRYARAIRRAHKMHHKHTGKEDGECFGMLWVPWKYFKNG